VADPVPVPDSNVSSAAVDRATLNVGLAEGGVWSIGLQ